NGTAPGSSRALFVSVPRSCGALSCARGGCVKEKVILLAVDSCVSRARVCLRAPTVGDREKLAALGKASRPLHHPWLSARSTPEAVDRWLNRLESDRFESFVVCRRADNAVVGVLNLSEIVLGSFRSAYSSYWAYAGYAGHGYMTEGLELLLRHAFRTMRL